MFELFLKEGLQFACHFVYNSMGLQEIMEEYHGKDTI